MLSWRANLQVLRQPAVPLENTLSVALYLTSIATCMRDSPAQSGLRQTCDVLAGIAGNGENDETQEGLIQP